jgi:hypothetical protein
MSEEDKIEYYIPYNEEKKLYEDHDITNLIYEKFTFEIWSDKDIVLEIVRNNGNNIKYASKKLKKDKDIILEALQNDNTGNQEIFNYVDDELKKDKELILELIEEGYESIYPYINEELKKDRDYILKLLKLNNYLFKYLYEEYKQDEIIITEGLKELYNIEYIDNLKDNMIIELFKNKKEEIIEKLNDLKKIKKRLEDKDLVIKLIKNKIDIYINLNKELQNDKDIIKYSMIYLKKLNNKYKYINDLIENKYEYNYDKIIKNFKYIIEMDNKVNIIGKLIDEDINKIKSNNILINYIINNIELEETFREKGVHFVEIIDEDDKYNFINEINKKLKGKVIFYEKDYI